MSTLPTRRLTADVSIPYLGFGTFLIPDLEASSAVAEAIRAGYRHIDTAEIYGNEGGVGNGIRQSLGEMGLTRPDIFVTTKLWPGNPVWGELPKTTETTTTSLGQSLERLGLHYVDLYLIHMPADREQFLAQWRGLVALKAEGKARAIGVSNFNITHLKDIEAAGLPKPDANQIELHPWSQKPDLTNYLKTNAITAIAYSSFVPLSTWRSEPGQDSGKTDQMRADGERTDSPFKRMAAKYEVSEPQILLRWAIQSGYPVLPKSTRRERIQQNADVFSFVLDEEDMASIAEMDRGDGVAWSTGDPTKAT